MNGLSWLTTEPRLNERSLSNNLLFVRLMLKQVGISAFPLSKGRDTGRGLERVIAELAAGLDALRQPYAFYERGLIRNEVVAILHAAKFLWDLRGRHQDVWFAVYPVAGIFPILAGKRPVITGVYDLIPFLSQDSIIRSSTLLSVAASSLCAAAAMD